MTTPTNGAKSAKAKPSKLVNSYTLVAQSASTKRSYAQDVGRFKAMCHKVLQPTPQSLISKSKAYGNSKH